MSIWDRFFAKVDTSGGPDACWPWTGAKSKKRRGREGWTYRGVFRVFSARLGVNRLVLTHRFVLCLVNGGSDIAALLEDYDTHHFEDGLQREASHQCGNRLCCNPTHLYWGTEDENRDDRYGARGAWDVDLLEASA